MASVYFRIEFDVIARNDDLVLRLAKHGYKHEGLVLLSEFVGVSLVGVVGHEIHLIFSSDGDNLGIPPAMSRVDSG